MALLVLLLVLLYPVVNYAPVSVTVTALDLIAVAPTTTSENTDLYPFKHIMDDYLLTSVLVAKKYNNIPS